MHQHAAATAAVGLIVAVGGHVNFGTVAALVLIPVGLVIALIRPRLGTALAAAAWVMLVTVGVVTHEADTPEVAAALPVLVLYVAVACIEAWAGPTVYSTE